ncbi:hypothetical protein [Cytobacillus kochii]|uniref:Uncharacterized protein n=1 Tax=Cytobacillus kochii TaxID=859143 RepID=A0A248THF7_9BACI|nr:hypothetical protein [Cytobacillus kochii]ASV67559.1 hypothetical protein CKF48_09635 [Cytobacillus kochii]
MTKKKTTIVIGIILLLLILALSTPYLLNKLSQGEFSYLPDGVNIRIQNTSTEVVPKSEIFLINGDEERVHLTEFPELKPKDTISFNTKYRPKDDYNLAMSYEINGKKYEKILMYAGANSTKLGINAKVKSINDKNEIETTSKIFDGLHLYEE